MLKAMVLSGLAAFLAYVINHWVVGRYGEKAIKFAVPLIEEILKTGVALMFRGPLVIIHIGFGLYEAVYDLVANPQALPGERLFAAFAALMGHGIFGGTTLLLVTLGLNPALSAGLVGLVHGLWNNYVLRKE